MKYLSNIWRTLVIFLISCESNLILIWLSTCVITNSTGAETSAITGTRLYVLFVTLSTQGNAELTEQLKTGLKRIINWNKYQPKRSIERQNPYLDYLVDPSFQRTNRLSVLSSENNANRNELQDIFFQLQ